jgi:hypothetical protein
MPISVNHKKTKEKGKNNVGQPWNQHDGPRTRIVYPPFLCLSQGANEVPPLPVATAAVKGKLTPVQGSNNQWITTKKGNVPQRA